MPEALESQDPRPQDPKECATTLSRGTWLAARDDADDNDDDPLNIPPPDLFTFHPRSCQQPEPES
eukprot:7110719-Pyramimonas_sp.AAC.1